MESNIFYVSLTLFHKAVTAYRAIKNSGFPCVKHRQFQTRVQTGIVDYFITCHADRSSTDRFNDEKSVKNVPAIIYTPPLVLKRGMHSLNLCIHKTLLYNRNPFATRGVTIYTFEKLG